MKKRQSFVSNSSSCSFIIVNRTGKTKTLVDFLDENPEIWDYYWQENQDDVVACGTDIHGIPEHQLKKQNVLQSAGQENEQLHPGDNFIVVHDDGQVLHEVVLHDSLENVRPTNADWDWRFDESFH
jgi:hypothetical protein